MCQLVVAFPKRQGLALGGTGAGGRIAGKAGHRRKRPLHQLQDLAHCVVFRRAAEPIPAALAAYPGDELAGHKLPHDDLQIFFGDRLSLGNVLERDIALTVLLRQI